MAQTIPSEFLAIDRKSRAISPCDEIELRPADERVRDFDDVIIPMGAECAQIQASRCIHCPDPAGCVVACPTHNDIPSAMWMIEQGDFLEAAKLYQETSSLPEICSRVCPHEALCQGACVMVKNSDPVLTGYLESFVMDFAREMGLIKIPVGEPTGKKVAVVGAGPAGLGCAEQLVQKGHAVTIFESKPEAGGLLVYGIPNFQITQRCCKQPQSKIYWMLALNLSTIRILARIKPSTNSWKKATMRSLLALVPRWMPPLKLKELTSLVFTLLLSF